MKRIIYTLIALSFVISTVAQQKNASISFNKDVHNFGTFKEEAGIQKYIFNFTNTGSIPLILTNVKASCGCTTPIWTKTPIAPGQKGEISVAFNPKNRPGKFNKTISVTSNSSIPTKVLRITGVVSPREKTLTDLYPQKMGNLRLKSNHLAFTKINNTQSKTDSLEIVNISDSTMTIVFNNVPAHLKLKTIPSKLKPKQKGYIVGTYTASLNKKGGKQDWGFIIDRVVFEINGKSKHKISVSATIQEDFSHYGKKLDKAPNIEFENTTFNFGTIEQGEKISKEFIFTNTGKTDLIIRKIKASCGCTATQPASLIIKPGQTSNIKATFNSRGKRGKQNKTITIITNSPASSSVTLRVRGMVTVPPTGK